MYPKLPSRTLLCGAAALLLAPDQSARAIISSPLDVPGHVLWLDGDDFDGNDTPDAGTSGTAIATWVDKSSGQGVNSVTATNGAPTKQFNVIGGHSAVGFTGGSQDKMDTASLVVGGNYTVFTVIQPSAFGGSGHVLSGLNSAGTDAVLYRTGAGGFRFYSGVPTGNTDNAIITRPSVTTASLLAYQVNSTGIETGIFQNVWIAFEGNGTAALNGLRLGNLDRDTPSSINRPEAFSGRIAEVIIYDRKLTVSEITDVGRYLNTKFQLGVAPITGALTEVETGQVSGGTPSTLLPGSLAPLSGRVNIALAASGGLAFSKDFIGPADPRNFRPVRLNDGLYSDPAEGGGVQEPWIAATLDSWAGVRFSAPATIDHIGFEDQFGSRRNGAVVFEYTMDDLSAVAADANVGLNPTVIAAKNWQTLDVKQIQDTVDQRHLYSFAPVSGVTAVRVRVESTAAEFTISELEVWSTPPPPSGIATGDGPGTVGTTDGASALELWVKADALSLGNGESVASWPDASGNGRTLNQADAGKRPVLVTSALSGKPVVRFTADWFESLTLPSTGNEFALVAVVKPATTGTYHNIIDDEDGARPMLWVDGAGNYEFSYGSGAVAPPGGGYDLLFAIKRGSGTQFSQLHLNGPAVTSGSAVNYPVAASGVYDLFNRDGGQAFTGDVAELIVYSTAPAASDINKIGFYLQTKYGLPTTFPPPFPIFTGYSVSPAIYGVNEAIVPNLPVVAGGVPTGFTITPALPAGLAMNALTGIITGTPGSVSATNNYTVSATFTGYPVSNAGLTLSVTPPTLTGYSRNPAWFTRGRSGRPLVPVMRGGPMNGFTVSPALPTGLTLNPATGAITGIPTVTTASGTWTITAHPAGYPDSSAGLTIEVLEPSLTLDITEFMASNANGLTDGDGVHSDWIEIHNYGAVPIDLDGWSLTDSDTNLRKWIFPQRILPPGAYLLVFASGDSHTDPSGYLHTNFRLSADGEYLGLTAPDGTTIVREFAPTFPPQTTDVSWGTNDRVSYGAYGVTTPGAANGFFDSVATRITALPAGRTFTGTLNVTLSAPLPAGAVIRYTLNNTTPGAASTLYSGPIPLTTNTRLRARVFLSGLNPGPELSESYLRLGAGADTFSSNLPIVFLNTDSAIAAAGSPTLTGTNTVMIGVDSGTGRAAATGATDYAGRSGLRIRGRSSQSFPQKQYKFETWNGADRETDAGLLGMPQGSDWVLYAPYTDKSLVRNALAYRMWELLGRTSLGTRFVEVFINDDNDPQFSYADDYAGIYMLVESPRLDLLGLDEPENSTTAAGITGGYLMEMGNADEQDFSSSGSGRAVAHRFGDKGREDLSGVQETWLRDYVSNFEQALYGTGFVHPVSGLSWRAYSSASSQVDYRIAREWSRNFDGGSTYYYIPRDGQLTMGPLWDYNWAFGNVNYAEGGDLPGYRTDGWNRSFTASVNGWSPWWLRMEQDPDWWQDFIDRWTTLREGALATAAVDALVNQMTQPLAAEATTRHFAKWPQLGQFTVISPPGWETRTTYQSEVDYLKTWMAGRSAWMDSQFPPRSTLSPAPGGVSTGSSVTLAAAPGQTIYYTLTGADPRLPGGIASPAVLTVSSGGSITINSSAIITARAKSGTVWGAPNTGAYVTGTPASPASLILTEINYHPAGPASPAELAALPTLSDDDFEFLELRNVSAGTIDLTGARFSEGIDFTFAPGTTLAPGAYLVVVENAVAFALRYGAGPVVAGQFTGNLDNDGDTIVLLAASGTELLRCHYTDAWTTAADGDGYSLTIRNPDQSPADYSAAGAWALSASLAGTPGSANGPVFTSDFTLWQQSTFSAADLVNPLRSGPLADPDGDEFTNLTEFALTSNPLSSTSVPLVTTALTGTDVVFTITRPRLAPGLSWRIESSANLTAWTAFAPSEEIVSQSSTTETVKLSTPHGGAVRLFDRISVTW